MHSEPQQLDPKYRGFALIHMTKMLQYKNFANFRPFWNLCQRETRTFLSKSLQPQHF
jgi:hypothetical protein